MKKQASLVAAILLWLIALAQLLRVLFRVEVTAGGVNIPLWVSILAVIVLGALGLWLWRERRAQVGRMIANRPFEQPDMSAPHPSDRVCAGRSTPLCYAD